MTDLSHGQRKRRERRRRCVAYVLEYLRKHGPTNSRTLRRKINLEIPSIKHLTNNALGMYLRPLIISGEIIREEIWVRDSSVLTPVDSGSMESIYSLSNTPEETP